MKLKAPVRTILILCLFLMGTLALSACASGRSSQPSYVFTAPIDLVEAPGQPRLPDDSPRRSRGRRTQERPRAADEQLASEGQRRPISVTPADSSEPGFEEEAERRSWLGRFRSRNPDSDESMEREEPQPAPAALYDVTADASEPGQAEATLVEPTRVVQGYRLRQGDQIAVSLRGVPEPSDYEFIIPDDGYIYMPYITPVQVKGLTISELQRLIHSRYVEEQIYRQLSVNVLMPTQHYFVRGEVRQPGRFPLSSGMTVLKAIAAAGGYTEFANPRRVEVIRAGETISGNARQMEQNPEEDFLVQAGDVIIVRRSIF